MGARKNVRIVRGQAVRFAAENFFIRNKVSRIPLHLPAPKVGNGAKGEPSARYAASVV